MVTKICCHAGCKQPATNRGRCDKHQTESAVNTGWIKRAPSPFYNSTGWRNMRARAIKEKPVCELCELIGTLTPAEHADHWLERREFPQFQLSRNNIISLCQACHNWKTKAYRAAVNDRSKKRLLALLVDARPMPLEPKYRDALNKWIEANCEGSGLRFV